MTNQNAIEINLKKGNLGFTILEVLVAMAIFSLGILAMASLQTGSVSGNASARFSTEAATHAQDIAERLMSLEYDPPPAVPISEFDPANNGTRAYTDSTGRYTIDWTVEQNSLNGIAFVDCITNAIGITVTVTWSSQGENRTVTINTVKASAI